MKKKIRAIVKRPEDDIGVITEIDNSLPELQKIVGGYIETVTLMDEDSQVVIICNEEGKLLDLPYNCTINGVDFVGPIIAVGIEGDDFGDLPSAITGDCDKCYIPQKSKAKSIKNLKQTVSKKLKES